MSPSLKAFGRLALFVVVSLTLLAPSQAATNIRATKHNLSPTGPGPIRATEPVDLCQFCHVPHNATPASGLWNHELPATTYTLYSSSTMKGIVNQPTGSSRLCLSCHDGTVALDSTRNPLTDVPMMMGRLTGRTVLGTDLSGSHPISFTYDTALALKNPELVDPHVLQKPVKLDADQQMQCTSCHNPHEDKYQNFLRSDNQAGSLCISCHRMSGWSNSAHATSMATWKGTGEKPWPADSPFNTVADNACQNCHRSHNAAHPERLLAQRNEPDNCNICHDGKVAKKNIAAEFYKPSHHPIESDQWTHDPDENPLTMQSHVACTDCHNPHAAMAANGVMPPTASGEQRRVKSVTMSGSVIPDPSFEYEVCNKCHGVTEPTTPGITRQSATRNIRTKINPSNASFHPIAAPGKNPTIQWLQAPYTPTSIIGCISCHNNNSWTATGMAPKGPHGSLFEPILAAQYTTTDPTVESYQNYALCYQCHNQTALITDQARTFPHQRHVVTDKAPCAACHDAHGSSKNAHLIDFMLRDRNGTVVVTPSASTGQLSYTSLGNGHGQCYLSCHGYDHKGTQY